MSVTSSVPAQTATPTTAVARLSTDAAAAQKIGDALAETFDGQEWLYFPAIAPQVAAILDGVLGG